MPETTTRLVVAKRHWMHVWKVRNQLCVVCGADSRVIATLVNENDEFVSQTLYGNDHAPELTELVSTGSSEVDIVRDITFRLGASFSVTDEE